MKKSFLTLAITTITLSTKLYASKLNPEDLDACRASEEARRNGAYQNEGFITNWRRETPLPAPQAHDYHISPAVQAMISALSPQIPGPHRTVSNNTLIEETVQDPLPMAQENPIDRPETPPSLDSDAEEEEIIVLAPLPHPRGTIENPFINGDFSIIDFFVKSLRTDEITVTPFHNGQKQYNAKSTRGQINFDDTLWNIELQTHISQGRGKREFQPEIKDLIQEGRNALLGRGARNWNIISRNGDIFTYALIQWHGALKYTYGTMTLSPAF